MKESAVSSKGDEVSKRDILRSKLTVSVSHDLSLLCEDLEDSSIPAGMEECLGRSALL